MSREPDERLITMAEALVDETPVDWDAELARSPELAETMRNLRTFASLANAHSTARLEWKLATGLAREAGDAAGKAKLFTWGPLHVLEKLGEGTSGEVFRAHEPSLKRDVALKLRRAAPAAGVVSRFLEEGSRLARVRHANVVTVHGADVHDGRAGIWTDLVRGQTLESWLQEHGPLGPAEATAIGLDLCRALAAVHAADLVHGDVKTTNVMREQGGRIVLMDFGSGHELAGGGRLRPATSVTPLTSAPEILRGESPAPSSDLYSLGVLLFRLVSRRYPIEASDFAELMRRHERGERAALRDLRPDLPSAFVDVVERAIAAGPTDRFATAGAMEMALSRTMSGTAEPRADRAPRRRWLAPLLAAAGLAAVVAIALVPRGTQETDASRTAAAPPAADRPATETPASTSPPAAATSSPASPAALDVRATLFRMGGSGPEALTTGARIRPGDALFMDLRSAAAVHAYVLNEDMTGNVFLLFPVPGLLPANPLAPGLSHRLPGRRGQESLDWEVTSAGGRETFLVLASREPVPALEQLLARVEPAREGRTVSYPQLDDHAFGVLRGVGGLKASRLPAGGSRLAEVERSLAARRDVVWMERIELENPAR